mmetsp:Transcript_54995/g.139420  ORF Transcript_54995/g.139420 Transcript_54995/m.139420 type:complete len:241 (+) Transcript_54995:125-847(+)
MLPPVGDVHRGAPLHDPLHLLRRPSFLFIGDPVDTSLIQVAEFDPPQGRLVHLGDLEAHFIEQNPGFHLLALVDCQLDHRHRTQAQKVAQHFDPGLAVVGTTDLHQLSRQAFVYCRLLVKLDQHIELSPPPIAEGMAELLCQLPGRPTKHQQAAGFLRDISRHNIVRERDPRLQGRLQIRLVIVIIHVHLLVCFLALHPGELTSKDPRRNQTGNGFHHLLREHQSRDDQALRLVIFQHSR